MLARTIKTAEFLGTFPTETVKIGTTPHQVIHRQGSAALRYFAPQEAKSIPVFISMPLINTWSIWDLLPNCSTIKTLVEAGVPVYLLDWGRPGLSDRDRPLEYFIDQVLGRAWDRAKRHAQSTYQTSQMGAVGYCVGGTFLAIFLARNPHLASKVAFVCTPIDFHQSGRLALWANPETFPLDTLIDGYGNFPAWRMRESFAWLKPMNQTRKWVSLWERIDREGFPELWAAMEKWNADNVDFPGETYRAYVRHCYFENALMKGSWEFSGKKVNLSSVNVPALTIAAADDHIVPPAAAFGLKEVWGGEVETKLLKGGHVGISVNPALPQTLISWVKA